MVERDPDTVCGPGVSFYSLARCPEPPGDYFPIPPDLAVEVLSPSDRQSAVREKVQQYLAAGAREVWVADPETRTVMVYRGSLRGAEYDEADTLDGGDVLPGFACQVADLFT
ncbi:MAG: Uma2 family endonuclease [Fimbriiglobus sp.]